MNAISLRTMGIRGRPINLFFLLPLCVLLAAPAGVRAADPSATNAPSASAPKKATKPKKASERMAVIRFHIEVTDDGNAAKAEVIRSRPQSFPIDKAPFFDERDVVGAQIVETPDGGFILQIDGTEHGRNALEMTTASANGRHILIYGEWIDDSETSSSRWLAAPMIRSPIRNGVIRFSVDADREEAQQFVDGINNVAIKLKNQVKGKPPSTTGTSKKPPVNSNTAAGEAINKSTRP